MPWIAQCPPGCGDGGEKSRSTNRNAATSHSNSGRFLDVPQPYWQGTLCRLYTSAGWTSPFVSQAPTGICKSTFIYLRPSSDPSLTQGAGYFEDFTIQKHLMYCCGCCCYYYYFNKVEEKNPGKTIYYCFWKPIFWEICDHYKISGGFWHPTSSLPQSLSPLPHIVRQVPERGKFFRKKTMERFKSH